MRYLASIVVLFLLTVVSITSFAGDYNYKPGMWETTTQMEVLNLPPDLAAMAKMPSQTQQDCIKGDEYLFSENDKKCKYDTTRVSAEKMKVNMTCVDQGKEMKGKGEVNFNGKTTSGQFDYDVGGPSGPMKMRATFTAKYIGACN